METPKRRRIKLAIMILVFGPIVLFGLYHISLATYKMFTGVPVGYEQRPGPPGVRR